MREALNDPVLNLVANSILLLILSVFTVDVFQNYRQDKSRKSRVFFSMVLSGTIYILISIIDLVVSSFTEPNTVTLFMMDLVRVAVALLMYLFSGHFILINTAREKPTPRILSVLTNTIPVAAFVLMPCLYIATKNTIITNIPIFFYLLFLEGLVLYVMEALGRSATIIYTLFIIPTCILTIQEYWNHTPPNIYATLLLVIIYSRLWTKQRELMLQKEVVFERQEKELAEMRISLLSSQINPHFLFNTFSALANLCEKDSLAAKNLILDLSTYMRGLASSLEKLELIPFENELKLTESFINIEKVRHGDSLSFDFDIEEKDFRIPPLTIQPIVENAVKHGVVPKGGGRITVETSFDKDNYVIHIMDDGLGFSGTVNDGKPHMGLKNVRKRLKYMCNGSLKIRSIPKKGTDVTILLPKDSQ